jgi:hypothetical protein
MNDIINNISSEQGITQSISETASTNYDVIAAIKKLDIITEEEITQFKNAQAFALSNFRDVPSYRPMIVKLVSVLNDVNFPTNDKKYWQCKSEAEVHFNELTRDYFKYKRSIIDIKEMEYKIQEIDKMIKGQLQPSQKLDPNLLMFDKERLVIQKDQYEYELKLLEKDIKYRIQEVVDWNIISKELSTKCEYSTINFQEHTVKGHILYLQQKVNDEKTPEAEKKMLKGQLDTFNRLNKRT